MKAYREIVSIALHILNLSSRWRWKGSLMPQFLYPGKDLPVPIEQEAERTPQPVWPFWRKSKGLPGN